MQTYATFSAQYTLRERTHTLYDLDQYVRKDNFENPKLKIHELKYFKLVRIGNRQKKI